MAVCVEFILEDEMDLSRSSLQGDDDDVWIWSRYLRWIMWENCDRLSVYFACNRCVVCFERQTHVQSFKAFSFMKDPWHLEEENQQPSIQQYLFLCSISKQSGITHLSIITRSKLWCRQGPVLTQEYLQTWNRNVVRLNHNSVI
jgi:hypothetical protein